LKLYFGCGNHKIEGFIGVDKIKAASVDIVHDMNLYPYPFGESTVEEVLLLNILEHFPDIIKVMEEIWRICKNGALIRVGVPYYNSPGAYQDPTHKSFFTENTFDYFTEAGTTPLSEFNYYSSARFKILTVIPGQRKVFNAFPEKIQWLLGHHLATIHSLQFELKVIKS
jgi:SAM-dependent methyltransferase